MGICISRVLAFALALLSSNVFAAGNDSAQKPSSICESLIIEATPSMIIQQHGDVFVYNEPQVVKVDNDSTFISAETLQREQPPIQLTDRVDFYDPTRINVMQSDNRFMVSGHLAKVGKYSIRWEPLVYVEPAPGISLQAHVQNTLRRFYNNPLLRLPEPMARGGMKVVWHDPINPRKLIKAFDFERLRPEQIVFAMQRDLGVEDIIRLHLIACGLSPTKADVLVVQRERMLLEAGIYMQDYADGIPYDKVIENLSDSTPSPLDFRPDRWPFNQGFNDIDPVLKALFEIDQLVLTTVQERFHGFVIGHMSPPTKDHPNPFPVFYGIDTTGANLFKHKLGKILVVDY